MTFITFENWMETAPSWVKNLPYFLQNLIYQLYQTFIMGDRWKLIADGLKITFLVTFAALLIGIILGFIVAIIRSTYEDDVKSRKNPIMKVLNAICKVYLSVIRGTPMMVQLLIMYFVIMVPKTNTGTVICGIITLGINSGAYTAEIARSGIMSIPKGQTEAGRSLGLNYFQTMWHIVVPQALKNILPALGNEMITLLKDTSLVSVITLRDVTRQTQNIIAKTYQPFVPYICLAIIYLIIVLALTKLLSMLEKGLRKSEH